MSAVTTVRECGFCPLEIGRHGAARETVDLMGN